MSRKIRVLFVIGSLTQAGAERYLFEYVRALDRRRFEVEVLTSKGTAEADFYCRALRALGVPVHRELVTSRLGAVLDLVPKKRRMQPLRRAVERADAAIVDAEATLRFRSLFARFDVVSFIQIEAYYLLQRALPDNRRVIVHLMSHRFQYDRPVYDRCLPGRRYRFLLFDAAQGDELRGSPAEGAETAVVPLALDLSGREAIYAPAAEGRRRIAIYSRIDPSRRMEPFLYAFQGLLRRLDAELVLYGRGDAEALRAALDVLRIGDRVVLAGHQEDLAASIRRDQPHLAWMIAAGGAVGYGSIEVASLGLPVLFFNFSAEPEEAVRARTGGAINAYASVPELVDASAKLLADPPALAALGARMRRYVFETSDITKAVHLLEAAYERLIAEEGEPGAAE